MACRLRFLQSPMLGRARPQAGEKVKRSLVRSVDPPTVLELTIDNDDGTKHWQQCPHYFANAQVIPVGGTTVAHERDLVSGTVASSLQIAKLPQGIDEHRIKGDEEYWEKKAPKVDTAVFVFPDIQVNFVGKYYLVVNVFEMRSGKDGESLSSAHKIGDTTSKTFEVHPAKQQWERKRSIITTLLNESGVRLKNNKKNESVRRKSHHQDWKADHVMSRTGGFQGYHGPEQVAANGYMNVAAANGLLFQSHSNSMSYRGQGYALSNSSQGYSVSRSSGSHTPNLSTSLTNTLANTLTNTLPPLQYPAYTTSINEPAHLVSTSIAPYQYQEATMSMGLAPFHHHQQQQQQPAQMMHHSVPQSLYGGSMSVGHGPYPEVHGIPVEDGWAASAMRKRQRYV